MKLLKTIGDKIRRWIRVTGSYIRQWMAPVVLATIVVTVLALFVHQQIANQGFKIQKELSSQEIAIQKESARQEMKRAAVSRSVALYQDFVRSKAVRQLRDTQYQIEHLVWKETKGKPEQRPISVFSKFYKKEKQKREEIRRYIVATFQRIKLIYKCGNFQGIYGNPKPSKKSNKSLCDRKTISTLLGGIFAELFVSFRAVFYCDPFFKDNYYLEGKLSGYVGMWESLVMDHLKRDMLGRLHGQKYGTFRDQAERKEAIKQGKIASDNKNYIVLRLTDKRCELYPIK